MLSAKAVFLIAFAFAGSGGADAAYYIKKKDGPKPSGKTQTYVAPQGNPSGNSKAQPKRPSPPAAPAAPQNTAVFPSYGPCTKQDIQALRSLDGAFAASAETAKKISMPDLLAFYSNPETVRSIALMNIRCADADLYATNPAKARKK